MDEIIDLRSDTLSQPSNAMREFMMQAQVGDDVFDEDPMINLLQQKMALLFGKEDALFCPSGTMCNQIALKLLTQPMQEVICNSSSHIYCHEGGGAAFHSGLSLRLVDGDRGRINAHQIIENINADNIHYTKTSMVSLENTSNKGGGSCYELQTIKNIYDVCSANNLKLHLDGARIMNAVIAKKYSTSDIGQYFDTLSVCLSKGLGAPVGSVLISSKTNIKQAKRIRKVFGGGMRQAGFLAAAGLYAIENNLQKLALDHVHAKTIAETLTKLNWVDEVLPAETNIVVFKINKKYDVEKILNQLANHQIKAVQFGAHTIRMVCYLNISSAMVDKTISVLNKFLPK